MDHIRGGPADIHIHILIIYIYIYIIRGGGVRVSTPALAQASQGSRCRSKFTDYQKPSNQRPTTNPTAHSLVFWGVPSLGIQRCY